MKAIFAAGGTAGHINPALAIADKLKSVFPDAEIMFIGTPQGMEARLVTKAGYNFTPVEMAGFQRHISIQNIGRNAKAAYLYFFAAKRAVRKILKEFQPDIVIGTGGYVTGTVLGQAAALGIKTVTHESNSYPGMATKMLAKKADKVLLATADAEKYLSSTEHCVVTGNPLRSNIKIEERSAARKRLGLPDQFTILSFGGSLGANRITEAVAELIAWEEKTGGINHIHSYGGKGKELFYSALEQSGAHEDKSKHIFRDYIDKMYTCMCAADLIISRAGAMTITELMAIGRPAVLVPYPNAAENHQYYNALTLSNAHAAILIEDKDLTKARLVEEVSELYNDRGRLALMEENSRRSAKNDAADRILGEIIDLLGKEKFENQGSTD